MFFLMEKVGQEVKKKMGKVLFRGGQFAHENPECFVLINTKINHSCVVDKGNSIIIIIIIISLFYPRILE